MFLKKKNKILIQEWVTYSKNFYSFLLATHASLLFDYCSLRQSVSLNKLCERYGNNLKIWRTVN